MDYEDTGDSVVAPILGKSVWYRLKTHRITIWMANRSKNQRAIGMIASASLIGTMIGIIGSLVQAHFITPDVLGFVRKYSIVSSYAIFFSLGLFIILHREYAFLIGRGEKEKANQTVAIVQSWCLLISVIVCGSILIITMIELLHGRWLEAAAWFIQVVAVWTILYVGFLDSTFRSGQEFERKAKGKFVGDLATAIIIPIFWLWSFPAFVLRSVVGSIITSIYLHKFRPVKAGWYLPWREFLDLAKRGLRLFVSDYLRYTFWLTVEIWLMLYFSGDKGVGLFVFSSMLVVVSSQISTAINMVYIPQLTQRYGQTENITSCLKIAIKPTTINIGISILIICGFWILLPPIISYAFPNYLDSILISRILIFRILLISLTLPIFMLTILEGYITLLIAAIIGLVIFIGIAFALNSMGLSLTAVPWGTLAGQVAFTIVCLSWLGMKVYSDKSPSSSKISE